MSAAEVGPACFSDDRLYRYWLQRDWRSGGRRAMWVGLNPSTADERHLDPTLRRVARYSRDWGYDGFVMTNLFAFRATLPSEMKKQDDPVGPDNDFHLAKVAGECELVICAWGSHGVHRDRSRAVVDLLNEAGHFSKLHALKIVGNGEPGHPLYLPLTARPIPYPPR